MSQTLKALWLTPELFDDLSLLGLTMFTENGEGQYILTAEGAQICQIVAEKQGLDLQAFQAAAQEHYVAYVPIAQDVDISMKVDALGASTVSKPIP